MGILIINEINDTFNKEYLPQIYFDGSYKSNYSNSLFNNPNDLRFLSSCSISFSSQICIIYLNHMEDYHFHDFPLIFHFFLYIHIYWSFV